MEMVEATTKSPSRGGAATLLLYAVLFAAIYWGVHALRPMIEPHVPLETVRDKVALTAGISITTLWLSFIAMVAVLRLRGQKLADIGWLKPAPLWGWLSAIILALLYAGFVLMGPLSKQPMLSDWSAFRIL